MFIHRYIPPHNIRGKNDELKRADDAFNKKFIHSEELRECYEGTLFISPKGNLIRYPNIPSLRKISLMTRERADLAYGKKLLEVT